MNMQTCYTLTSPSELASPTARILLHLQSLLPRMFGSYFKHSTHSFLNTKIATLAFLLNLMEDITGLVSFQHDRKNFQLTEPEFAYYFESQNTAIASGTVTGQNISLVALGINNGWYDPILQYKAYVDYSYNNTYKSLISSSQHTSYLNTYTTKCLPLLKQCSSTTGSNTACENAESTCYNDIEGPLSQIGDFDVYDIREPSNDPYPPETYVTYLQSSAVMTAIGAKSTYAECPDAPYEKFSNTGDGKLSSTILFSCTNST